MGEETKYRLGIDIGGTFTDLTLISESSHEILGIKTPTVPLHPEQGVVNGLRILKEKYQVDLSDIRYFVHGTTIGLNTLLQRKGSKLVLLVTEGFRDILNMQRMRLPVPYDFHSRLPAPLIPRERVLGVSERVHAGGKEIQAVDFQSVDRALEEIRRQKAEGVAVCFLHSYINGVHEKQVKEYLQKKAPDLKICISSEVWPEMREYERAVIAVVNLYIQKNVETYFQNLKDALQKEGIRINPFITQSNGGIMNLESAALAPVKTLFSGPAAGVIGAIAEAGKSDETNLLTFDMGGTSTDIAIVSEGNAPMGQSSVLAGFPIVIPAIDIESIGAGGGSVGWIDNGGMLKVGPESAGSDPGPACYGKSHLATLTDAFLLCGYLNAEQFAAGSLKLDAKRSEEAIGTLAQKLNMETKVLADRMIQIAVANMYAQLSNVMEQRGFDPRELTVMAYGGGGPVTANFIAEEIHARKVLVPYRPGTLCAMGSLSASMIYDAVQPVSQLLGAFTLEQIRGELKKLTGQAIDWIGRQNSGLDTTKRKITFLADARYAGQSYEIQVALTEDMLAGEDHLAVTEAFHRQHQKLYGHSEASAQIELVSLRARVVVETPSISGQSVSGGDGAVPVKEQRRVIINGKEYSAAVYERTRIPAQVYFSGPAVVEQDDTTVLILPGWEAHSDQYGNLHITRKKQEEA